MSTTGAHYVFVYGILMRDARIAARLPEHRIAMIGNATIVPSPGDTCYGGLALVDDQGLRRYDRIESCHLDRPESGYYQRKLVQVRAAGLGWVTAWAYEMNGRYRWPEEHDPYLSGLFAAEYARLGHSTEAQDALSRYASAHPAPEYPPSYDLEEIDLITENEYIVWTTPFHVKEEGRWTRWLGPLAYLKAKAQSVRGGWRSR